MPACAALCFQDRDSALSPHCRATRTAWHSCSEDDARGAFAVAPSRLIRAARPHDSYARYEFFGGSLSKLEASKAEEAGLYHSEEYLVGETLGFKEFAVMQVHE